MNNSVSRSPVRKVSRLRPEDRGRAAFHPHSMYRVPEFSGENALTELDYLPKGGLEHRARVTYSRSTLRNEVLGVKPPLDFFGDDNVKPDWHPDNDPESHTSFRSENRNENKEIPYSFSEDRGQNQEIYPIVGSFSGFDYEQDALQTGECVVTSFRSYNVAWPGFKLMLAILFVVSHESRRTAEGVSSVMRYSESQDSVGPISGSGTDNAAYTCKVERTSVVGSSDPRRSYTCVPYDYHTASSDPRRSYNLTPLDYPAPRHSKNTNNWSGRGTSVPSFGRNGKRNWRGGKPGPVYNAGK